MKKKVIICPSDGRKPYVTSISMKLENLQKLVGGYIETVTLPTAYDMQKVIAIVNEEGRMLGLPRNHCIGTYSFVGDVVLVSADQDDFTGLDDDTSKKLLAQCKYEWNLHYNQTPARVPV